MKCLFGILLLTFLVNCKGKQSASDALPENKSQSDEHKPGISNDILLKTFMYNPAAGQYLASVKLLEIADVENLLQSELEIMRNEIFARHGFIFEKKVLRDYFQNQDWYTAKSTDIKADLTPLEKKNIALIRRFEDYADEHGDDFGR